MGCEFALPFVFPPYFAETCGGKEEDLALIFPFNVVHVTISEKRMSL